MTVTQADWVVPDWRKILTTQGKKWVIDSIPAPTIDKVDDDGVSVSGSSPMTGQWAVWDEMIKEARGISETQRKAEEEEALKEIMRTTTRTSPTVYEQMEILRKKVKEDIMNGKRQLPPEIVYEGVPYPPGYGYPPRTS